MNRYEAYMDGESLSSIDPKICLLDIQYSQVSPNISTFKVNRRHGALISRTSFNECSVTILFEIHEYNTRKRINILQNIQRWARGTILTVSDRPGQRLRCVCKDFPTLNTKGWTDSISITFVAYQLPFWEEANATTFTMSGTSGESSVYVPGNAPESLVSASLTCSSGTLSTATLTVNGKSMVLSELAAATPSTVVISYDDDMILHIRHNNVDALGYRTPASVDDLLAVPGKFNTFAFSADQSISLTYTVRGLWL